MLFLLLSLYNSNNNHNRLGNQYFLLCNNNKYNNHRHLNYQCLLLLLLIQPRFLWGIQLKIYLCKGISSIRITLSYLNHQSSGLLQLDNKLSKHKPLEYLNLKGIRILIKLLIIILPMLLISSKGNNNRLQT